MERLTGEGDLRGGDAPPVATTAAGDHLALLTFEVEGLGLPRGDDRRLLFRRQVDHRSAFLADAHTVESPQDFEHGNSVLGLELLGVCLVDSDTFLTGSLHLTDHGLDGVENDATDGEVLTGVGVVPQVHLDEPLDLEVFDDGGSLGIGIAPLEGFADLRIDAETFRTRLFDVPEQELLRGLVRFDFGHCGPFLGLRVLIVLLVAFAGFGGTFHFRPFRFTVLMFSGGFPFATYLISPIYYHS